MTDHSPVLREHGYHELRVKGVVHETHDASSFVLEVPGELKETFRYWPGRYRKVSSSSVGTSSTKELASCVSRTTYLTRSS